MSFIVFLSKLFISSFIFNSPNFRNLKHSIPLHIIKCFFNRFLRVPNKYHCAYATSSIFSKVKLILIFYFYVPRSLSACYSNQYFHKWEIKLIVLKFLFICSWFLWSSYSSPSIIILKHFSYFINRTNYIIKKYISGTDVNFLRPGLVSR